MTQYFAARLTNAIQSKQCCGVVNIDPVIDRLPPAVRDAAPNDLAAIHLYSEAVIDAVSDCVAVVKFNIAYFEVFGPEGIAVYERLIQVARNRELLVIGDIKRGDVGHTAEQYARAHLSKENSPDAITINGYFGWDGVKPFAEMAAANGRGVFVLVRTSNPSSASIQDQPLSNGQKVHGVLANQLTEWNASFDRTDDGFGPIGAVVATRDREDAARLRSAMPHSWLLVPGYGAQGGTAADFAPYLNGDGLGALIAAGRSVIYAYEEEAADKDWRELIAAAGERFKADLAGIVR